MNSRLARFSRLGALVCGCVLTAACSSDQQSAGTTGVSGGAAMGLAGSGAGIGGSRNGGSGSPGAAGGMSAIGGTASSGGSSGSGDSGSGSVVAGAGGSATGGAGGAGGAGGTGGAAAAAGGTAGATSGCAGKTYKLCEDFETGTAAALPAGWSKVKGYGAGSAQDENVASDQFHSGSKALKSISASKGAMRIQKSIAGLGATASKHWGRIFYKVQSPAPSISSSVLHVTFLGLLGSGENRVVDTVEAQGSNKHQWLFNNPDDSGSVGSAYDWTFDADWHCAEWYVDVGSKSYRFFSDAKEVTAIGFSNKADSEMSNYSSILLGATYYQSPDLMPPFTVWFDDLAIDDTQIGCQ